MARWMILPETNELGRISDNIWLSKKKKSVKSNRP